MSQGEAWVEVQAREKREPTAPALQEKTPEKRPAPAEAESDKQDKQDRPVKSDGNASFLRAARAGNLDKVLEYLKGSTDINTSNANGLNALHLASKEGHVNIVTELVSRGANVDAATKKGNTALHIASLAGQEEIVKILVQKGAKVNVQSQNGFTPLYMAAQENHAGVVQYLLDSGGSQSVATDDGFTPLAVALQQGHDKVVAVLLENDTRGRVKLPALHIAAKKDDVKAATLLLQNDHNVDSTSKSGFTPLHIAAHYGNTNVGQLLVNKGADINFKARNAITPLHVSSKWGRTNMVTLLLDSNAAIDARTRDGLTALHCAARSGHDQVVDLLLEKGAPVAAKTKNGLSPLHMSAQGDHVECARHLLEHQAPINDVTVDYLTPLHVAAHCGNVRTAKLLLDRKCEVNARALNGFTPLHIACKKNRIKVVELLLKYGGNIDATTESGLTPLHVAAFMGHMNIVIYLIQHGANPDTPTVRGETALHLAARANQTDIIRILLRNGATVDAKAREQQTPLHIAARLGNVDNVALLLQHGANPDATTKDLYTPLHIAAKEGHEEVCAVLLDHRASLNLTTKKGFTPLHIAAKYGKIKVARLLLQKGADPDIQGANGLTPLHVATHYNNVNVALLLLEHKASPHVTAKNGYTPLHIAAKKNQMDIATTLLEFGAKPNAESKSGFTPLHLASQEGHTDMVSLLLQKGADVNCRAKNGLTPMHLAAQEDKVPVAEILVKYGSEIDPQTKAGYTPLHTACHFGQINMIRFLLEHGANVNATTKLGYTPLHQAAQQGHVLVINLLLKYKADPNKLSTNGQTPLSIAQRLGYISVVEILKTITEVQASPSPGTEEKYKVVSPETMQETLMTDSEDEGGDDTILNDRSYMSAEDMKFLADDSISPARDEFRGTDRYSTLSSTMGEELRLLQDDTIPMTPTTPYPPVFKTVENVTGSPPPYATITETSSFQGHDNTMNSDYDLGTHEVDFMESKGEESLSPGSPYPYSPTSPKSPTHNGLGPIQEEKVEASKVHAVHAGRPEGDAVFSSYSGMSFSSSFDPDNVQVDRTPQFSGFLVSFMVDARGGAMRGCRHSGVRIIIPPGHTSMPTRVTCKLVKKEKLTHPPPLMEGEALASRILEMGPSNAKFLGPVVIEVPHFASLRGKEREIVILRSDNGETWREHTIEATDAAIQDALHGSFEDLESAEDIYKTRITRVLTTDFPQYFAVVTRIRQETCTIGTEGGMISSTVVPQVQAVFPDGSLTKKIKVGLQAQPVQPELVSKMLGNRVAVSPIVTVEPRRRKFHKPITLTIPVPKASQKGMINQYGGETPTLRLLCSITDDPIGYIDDEPTCQWANNKLCGGTSPAQWEDITGSTPLKFINDCVSFTTTVSARFWLMDCQNINEAAKMSTELYREAIAVPFMAKFVVFAKRQDHQEARLRLFCMTDDKMDKTLESQEHFEEIARSRDVEVLDSKPQYVEMAGNLVPVTKSGEQLYVNFNAFRENRLPFNVRIRDLNQDPLGRVAFMKEPKQARDQAPQTPICNLNITLPGGKGDPGVDVDSDTTTELRQQFDILRGEPGKEQISRAELRLTDIAEDIGSDWVPLARELRFTEEEITTIQTEYTYTSEQALVMLQQWLNKNGDKATGNELERALKSIGREDVIQKNMRNVEDVGDAVERAVAKVHIDQAGFDAFKEELGPSRGSSVPRGVSLDVSYDEHDLAKDEITELDKRETKKHQDSDVIVAETDDRHGVVKTITEAEREAAARDKAEAYLQLAETMGIEDVALQSDQDGGDSIQEEPILEERKDSLADDLLTKVEALKVEGMDDRVSLDSDEGRAPEVVEDVVTKEKSEKVKSAPTYEHTQTFEDWAEQNAAQYTAAEERAQPDQATFEDWVEKKRIDDSVSGMAPEVVTETLQGDVEPRSSVDTSEITQADGTVVIRRVETIEHVRPIIERNTKGGEVVSENVTHVLIGTEVVEEVTELPPGADPDDISNAETSVEEWEESSPDGTWQKHKIVRTRIVPPTPDSLSPAQEAPPGKMGVTMVEGHTEFSSFDQEVTPQGEYTAELTPGLVQESVPTFSSKSAEPPEDVSQGFVHDTWKEELADAQLERQAPHDLSFDSNQVTEKQPTPEIMSVPSPEYPQDMVGEYVPDDIVVEKTTEVHMESKVLEDFDIPTTDEIQEAIEETDGQEPMVDSLEMSEDREMAPDHEDVGMVRTDELAREDIPIDDQPLDKEDEDLSATSSKSDLAAWVGEPQSPDHTVETVVTTTETTTVYNEELQETGPDVEDEPVSPETPAEGDKLIEGVIIDRERYFPEESRETEEDFGYSEQPIDVQDDFVEDKPKEEDYTDTMKEEFDYQPEQQMPESPVAADEMEYKTESEEPIDVKGDFVEDKPKEEDYRDTMKEELDYQPEQQLPESPVAADEMEYKIESEEPIDVKDDFVQDTPEEEDYRDTQPEQQLPESPVPADEMEYKTEDYRDTVKEELDYQPEQQLPESPVPADEMEYKTEDYRDTMKEELDYQPEQQLPESPVAADEMKYKTEETQDSEYRSEQAEKDEPEMIICYRAKPEVIVAYRDDFAPDDDGGVVADEISKETVRQEEAVISFDGQDRQESPSTVEELVPVEDIEGDEPTKDSLLLDGVEKFEMKDEVISSPEDEEKNILTESEEEKPAVYDEVAPSDTRDEIQTLERDLMLETQDVTTVDEQLPVDDLPVTPQDDIVAEIAEAPLSDEELVKEDRSEPLIVVDSSEPVSAVDFVDDVPLSDTKQEELETKSVSSVSSAESLEKAEPISYIVEAAPSDTDRLQETELSESELSPEHIPHETYTDVHTTTTTIETSTEAPYTLTDQAPDTVETEFELVNELDIPENGTVQEYEKVLPDGSVVKQRVVLIQTGTSVIKTITTYMPDGEVQRETITEPNTDMPLESEIIADQLEQVQDQPDAVVVTDLDHFQQDQKVEEAEDIPEPEDVDEFEETLPDGTVVTRRIVTRRYDTVITRTIITIYPNGRTVEETLTEDIEPEDQPKIEPEVVDVVEATAPVVEEVPSIHEEVHESLEEEMAPLEVKQEEPEEPEVLPEDDVEEITETLPDGTIVRRRIIKKKIRVIKKKIRTIGPDGEVTEQVVTEEVPMDADTEALLLQQEPHEGEDDDDDVALGPGGIKVYADTVKGEPVTDTDVQEFEETLPDGTIVKRRVVKTKQKQMVVKRFVMEGPQGELPTTDEEAHRLLAEQAPGQLDPNMHLYVDRVEGEPEETSDVQEFEETLPDGTVVKRRVLTTKKQQMITEHKLTDGEEMPELATVLTQQAGDDIQAESTGLVQTAPAYMVHEETPEETITYEQESPQGVQEPEFSTRYDEDSYGIQPEDSKITVESTSVTRTVYRDDIVDTFLDETVETHDQEVVSVTQITEDDQEPLERDERTDIPDSIETEIQTETSEPVETELKLERYEHLETGKESPELLEAEVQEEEIPVEFEQLRTEHPEPCAAEIIEVRSESVSVKADVPLTFPIGIEPHTEHVETHIKSPDREVMVAGKDFPQLPHETTIYKEESTHQYVTPGVDERSTRTITTTVHKTTIHSQKQDSYGAELPILAPIMAQMKSVTKEQKPIEYYHEAQYEQPVIQVEPVVQIAATPVVSIEQPDEPMADTWGDHEISHEMEADDDGLMAPQIMIQSATPIQRSPEDQDKDYLPTGFTPITVEDTDIKTSESEEEIVRYSTQDIIPESSVPTHAKLRLSSSLEAQPGSPSPSDFDDFATASPNAEEQMEQEDEMMEERPLSPTDYVLEVDTPMTMSMEADAMARSMEGETVDEGRISSDTSQQIFIEQTIEAAKEKRDSVDIARPPSPTDYTLVLDGSLATEPEDTKPTDVATDDEDDLPAAMVVEPPESMELVSAQTATFVQQEFVQEPMEASEFERHRLKSSFEDLYTCADLSYESGDTEDMTVGDKFDTRQYEKHLERHPDKSSSFENLYLETPKEAEDEEEKDVDEKERLAKEVEEEFQRPEKGETENEKEYTIDDEEYDEFEEDPPAGTKSPDIEVLHTVRFSADAIAQPDLMIAERHHAQSSPIDGTYEEGLDSIGKETTMYTTSEEKETFLRSSSCDEQAELAMSDRERHHSAPESFASKDDVLSDDGISSSSSEMAQVEEIRTQEHAADHRDEDAGSEGTDIEDAFSPTPRDELTLSTHSALLSHSPPEPLSPTKQKQLKDELSPLYDLPPDVGPVGVTLGRSPSDFIAELPEEEEIDEQTDTPDTSTDIEPKHEVKTFTKTEKTTDGDLTRTVTETKTVTETHKGGTVTTQTVKTTSHVEYMSFDNVGFMGKTRIDEVDVEVPAPEVVVHEPIDKQASHDDISPESDSDKYGDEYIKELKEHASIAVNDEAVRKASAPHIEIPPHIEMGIVLDDDSPEQTDRHVLVASDSFEKDTKHVVKGGPPIMAELDTDDSVDTLVAEKEVLEMPVTEPHELINDAHTYSVIETISERHTHDLHIPGEYLMQPGSFRIGQIEYVPRQATQKPEPAEESSTPDLSPNEVPVYETISESLVTSTMTSSFLTAKTSLENSTMLDSSTTMLQSAESWDGDAMPTIQEPEIEERKDSACSIESDELEETYDNQLEEMEQEMQRTIAPSPLPPMEVIEAGQIRIEDEEASLEMEEAADEVQLEMAPIPDRRESDVIQTKHVASLSSESLVKTSTSSDASAEPTLLAATYDLELGAVSHVVATFDISPDSVEKHLPIETKPKAILSSPEDEVFEYDSVGLQRDKTPDKSSEHEDERISSPFEVISDSDLAGFEDYSVSNAEVTGAAVNIAPSVVVPVTLPGPGLSESSHEPETPTFDHSSPASSSAPSDTKELSPVEPAVPPIESQPSMEEIAEEPKPEAFLMLNGPTEVEYTPEHDDGLISQPTPADTMADISEVDTDREAQEEPSTTTSLMEEATGPTGTESVMEDLSVPDQEKMLTSDQTLFDLEMPTEEVSLKSIPTEGEVSEMESKSHEMEIELKQDTTEEKYEDASSCTKTKEIMTSEVPTSYVAEALEPEPMDTQEKEEFPTGKAMLESEAAYEIFGEAVLSDVPQSYATQVVQDKEPENEDEYLMATGLEPGVTLEQEMMNVLEEAPQTQYDIDEGSLAAEAEQPDSELLALADEEEDDDKIQTGTEFSTIDEPNRPQGLSLDGASLRPEAMDIDRPTSPIPDTTRVMWDDPEIEERLHQMEEEEAEEIRSKEEDEKENSHSEDSSAVLEVQAAVFVHGVLTEAQASILRDQHEEDVTEPDQELSTDLDSQRTDISEVHTPPADVEPVKKRPPLEPQASEDIPTISITQHLHAETKEEDYPTTYARGASLDLLDEDEEDEPMQTTEHEPEEHTRSGPQDYDMPCEAASQPPVLDIEESIEKENEPPHEIDHFLGAGRIEEIGPDIMDMKDRPEMDSPEQEVLSSSSKSSVDDPEASSGQDTDSDEERARFYTQEQHFLAEGLEVRQEMDTIDEVSEPEESPVEDAHPHDADSGDEDLPIGVIPQVDATDLVSPEDMGDSSSVDSFATVVALEPDQEDDVEDRLAEVASMTSSIHSEITSVYQDEQPEPAISIDVRDLPAEIDLDKSSSTSSEKVDTLDKDSLNDVSMVTPDDEKFELIQKYKQPRKSTSTEELLILAGTGQMSPGNISTTGQFFYSKSGDKDDISISSSLLEFESLEKEVQDKVSLDSLERISSKRIYSKSGENDDISISSSLAEFETLEKEITESKEKISGESKSSLDASSHSSLAEFEKLEEELQNDSDERRSSSDSNGQLEKTSQKSSTSSLTEFEQLEEQILIDQELQAEAQKVVSMLESGALLAEMGHPGDSPLMSPPQQAMSVEHLQDQVVPDIEMPLEEEEVPDSEEKMDHDSLSDSDEERIFHMESVILEASLNVESFEKSKGEDISESDSLDGKDDQIVPLTTTAVAAANLDVVPAEHVTRDIDADSLQDSESHSKSGALDTDSLQDPDSVMAASAESFEFDPPPGVTTEAALISAGLISHDIMEHSTDSIDPSIPIIPYDTEMTRSSDSLDMDVKIAHSHSTQSFDRDSLHDEPIDKQTYIFSDKPLQHEHPSKDLILSSESGAWSQTSSGEVSPQKTVTIEKTVKTSGGMTTTRVIQTTQQVRHTTFSEDNVPREITRDSAFFDTEGNVLQDTDKQTKEQTVYQKRSGHEPDVGKLTFSYTTTSSTVGGRDSDFFNSPLSDPAFQNTPSTQSSPTDSSHSDTCYCGPDISSAALASQGWPTSSPSTGAQSSMHPRIESIDDDEMREFDPYEHQELAQGIPSSMAQPVGPDFLDPDFVDSSDDEIIEHNIFTGDAAEGGDMQETKVVLKKQIHKKTIVKDGQEETVITEDTHVEQDNEGPGELRDSMQKIIDEFMDSSGAQPQSKSSEV